VNQNVLKPVCNDGGTVFDRSEA